jgi:hypothetical protein
MLIFFDTEFTELGLDARLISIGFVSESGQHEFYAELEDTYQLDDCSDFVRESVLPHLQGGNGRMSLQELTVKLGNWLEGFEEPVQLATDSLHWDWPWVQKFFKDPHLWPINLAAKPLVLGENPELGLAIEAAFTGGLCRHDALDDAKANRLGWLALESK